MNTETKLQRIALLSSKDKDKVFDCLMHHINDDLLRNNFRKLDENKAKGIDGVSKEDYNKNLDENLRNLLDEMKRMAYKPMTVKEVLIPK